MKTEKSGKRLVRTHYGRWRIASLLLAFFLILVIPVLNVKYGFHFIQGWFQSLSIGNLWFVSPLEGIESILTSRSLRLSLLIGMAIPVIVAMLAGRVFCSWVCPISLFSEAIDRIMRRGSKYHIRAGRLPGSTLWFALAGEILLAMITGAPLFVFLSPPGLAGREIMMLVMFQTLALEGVVLLAVLMLHVLFPRFFCRHLCPLGALLALMGGRRKMQMSVDRNLCIKCAKCRQRCPMGLDPSAGEGALIYCWNCGECADSCAVNALRFRWRGSGYFTANPETSRPVLPLSGSDASISRE